MRRGKENNVVLVCRGTARNAARKKTALRVPRGLGGERLNGSFCQNHAENKGLLPLTVAGYYLKTGAVQLSFVLLAALLTGLRGGRRGPF